jgi:hypothetical protein
MLEFTQETLLTDDPPAGLTPRQASLVAYCAQLAREMVEAVEPDYFDEGGLRFAIVTQVDDLGPDGALASFLGASGDPLPVVLDRLEGSHILPGLQAHLLLLSISDTGGDYLVIPDECLNSAWAQVIADLHPTDEPAVA